MQRAPARAGGCFGAGEGSVKNGLATINQLRQAFSDAQAHKVTVLASSSDGGTTNAVKEPVKIPGSWQQLVDEYPEL
jgi:hypothetical protein